MKYTMTLFIAEKEMNELMKAVGLKDESRWFVKPVSVGFQTKEKINEDYFNKMIEESKKIKDAWVPAIGFCDTVYSCPSVVSISDGAVEMFIKRETP